MSETAELLKKRTMRFALDVCALIKSLGAEEPAPTVKRQLVRASTGVAFNYRAACRARSHAEFTAKIGCVAEEADESQGWLEFIEAAGLMTPDKVTKLIAESKELVSIMSASVGTARYNQRNRLPARAKRP